MSSPLLRSLFAAGAVALAGCGASSGYGTLAVALTDAPSPDVKGIVVTIETVTAHSEQAGWVTVAHGPITVDLLALQDVSTQLGEVSLPAGTVNEIRLILAEDGPQYVVLTDDRHAPLKTPSGAESGVKLKGKFEVSACVKHTVTLDFDGKNSIAYHETGGPDPEWILRPVVHVKAEADEAQSCSADGGTPDSGTPDSGTPPVGDNPPGTPDAGTGSPDGGICSEPSDPNCTPIPT
ncbi:MAG: DUF4382 domain-containing protein [Myxococcaceae bacterium]|nr:MAG: DUF4382 domain-containing protein [Myxococcaceae bacterium]